MTERVRYWLPRWAPMAGLAFAPWVLLKRGRDDLLAHERVHLEQQARLGRWRFARRYLASGAFRARAEAEAYLAQTADRAWIAARLYSALYLWCWPAGRRGVEAAISRAVLNRSATAERV